MVRVHALHCNICDRYEQPSSFGRLHEDQHLYIVERADGCQFLCRYQRRFVYVNAIEKISDLDTFEWGIFAYIGHVMVKR